MARKSPSKAVQAAVETAVPVVAPVEVPKVRGDKKFTAEQYVAEYLAEQASGGTWASLCERTGFTLNNVRQAITTRRSTVRELALNYATEVIKVAKLKTHANYAKAVAILADVIGEQTAEQYAEAEAEKAFPFLQEGTRNTKSAIWKQSVESKYSL